MRKILLAIVVATTAMLIGGCNADMRGNPINTDITFTIQGWHQRTLDPVVPLIDVAVTIPGYAPWIIGQDVAAPYQFTIHSSDYHQAANDVLVTAQLVDPNPDVVLRCTWTAQTPSGTRLSRDSGGGEGESYAGAPVRCRYIA